MLTAQWDGTERLPDPELLDRATDLARVLVTHDIDLLAEAALRQRNGIYFAGLIFAPQTGSAIGRLIEDLVVAASVMEQREMENRVEFLPL